MIVHNFDPVLIDLGLFQVRWYSIAYIMGIILGWIYALKIIKETLKDIPVNIWDGLGITPYFGIVAHADTFVVTGDSVNMVSEAIATKKQVHVYKNFGGSINFDRFHNELETLGRTRPFTGQIESWEYKGIDDMTIAADAVKKAWDDYKN